MRTTSGEIVETLPRSFQVHSKICMELMRILDDIMRIFPDIEDARPKCSSGIESLVYLNNSIQKAKLLLQHCSECSKLYLAVTGDTVLLRCQKAKKSLEQSLIPIQGMVPVVLAVEVSRIVDDLERATFVLDSAEEEAGKVLTELLQQGTSNLVSAEDFELKALQFAAPRLNITSQKALLIEGRSIKNLLDKIGPNDQKKTSILRYLMYLLKKHGKSMVVGEHMEKVYSRSKEPTAKDNNSNCHSLRSNRVELDPNSEYDQCRTHMSELDTGIPPEEYKCPISSRLMYDPVIIASGVTYERMWITKWFNEGKTTCPKTENELPHMTSTPNVAMKDLISKWCKNSGVSIPDPSRHAEDFQLLDASITSIKSLGSYFNDLNLPLDLSIMSLGSLDTSFTSDASRGKTNHDLNLMMSKASEDSHKHRDHAPEIPDTDLMLLPKLHDLQWDSQCKVIEDLKDRLKSNSQAILSVSAEKLVEPLVKFLGNANDLQDEKALRSGTQLLLEFVNSCRNGMDNLSEDTFIMLASLLNSEVIGEVLAIMEELSGNSKSKIEASSALTSVLKLLDSDNRGFQQQAIRILYNFSFNSEVCLHMLSHNCIQKLLPFFKDRAVLRYCIYILKNICDTEEGRNSIAETKGCIASIAEILETGSNEEQEHALSVLLSLCSCSKSVDYCKLILDEEIIAPLFYISQNGNDKGKESAVELLHLLRDAEYVENENNRPSQPITNNTFEDSNSHTEENRTTKRSKFLKKLGLFSKPSSHALKTKR
ncbi:unnamed protein product [Vicia faba]|uniref:RING-type E3 ubiquitin transferase n=1 Tax=Vicia faba TaxID=3906 RepID=A0AAV0YRE3_VICFA|nr:unnamed protein product [Vicia faba]